MNGFDSTSSQVVLQDSKHMGLGIGEYHFSMLCLGDVRNFEALHKK
jgi:hypothetical protein